MRLTGYTAQFISRWSVGIGAFRSSLFRREVAPSAVRCQTILLLRFLTVGIHALGVSEPFRRCLEQQGIRTVFKSETTLRSHLVRPKDTVDLAKKDGVVYRIPCECGKVCIGETGRSMHERIKEGTTTIWAIIRFGTR